VARQRDYSVRLFRAPRAHIVLSSDLNNVPYREYVIPFPLDRLTSIALTVKPLLSPPSGTVGVEIVSASSEILAQTRRELKSNLDGVTVFDLPFALTNLAENWLLRVFVQEVDGPVSLYELVSDPLFRGQARTLPLVLFT
jgi:hypothetical protein